MSTSGETADLMVREGIQITESALKLAGLGAKNLAALLIALANDNQKLAGKTNLKRLIHDGEELAGVRGDVLWGLDRVAKLRRSHENPSIQAVYRDYLGAPLSERAEELLHTNQHAWKMPREA